MVFLCHLTFSLTQLHLSCKSIPAAQRSGEEKGAVGYQWSSSQGTSGEAAPERRPLSISERRAGEKWCMLLHLWILATDSAGDGGGGWGVQGRTKAPPVWTSWVSACARRESAAQNVGDGWGSTRPNGRDYNLHISNLSLFCWVIQGFIESKTEILSFVKMCEIFLTTFKSRQTDISSHLQINGFNSVFSAFWNLSSLLYSSLSKEPLVWKDCNILWRGTQKLCTMPPISSLHSATTKIIARRLSA